MMNPDLLPGAELLAVASITILAVVSPGADFAMVTRNSMLASRRAGVFSAVGIALGVWLHVGYALLGLAWLLAQSPWWFFALKVLGAAYLLYLGLGMLGSRPQAGDGAAGLALADWAALRSGLLTNALNPKTTLFVLSLFSQVIHPATPLWLQLAYGAFMSLAHLLWFALVACAFSSQAARGLVARYRHRIEQAIGAVLVLLAVVLGLASWR